MRINVSSVAVIERYSTRSSEKARKKDWPKDVMTMKKITEKVLSGPVAADSVCVKIYINTDRQAGRQAGRQSDRQPIVLSSNDATGIS